MSKRCNLEVTHAYDMENHAAALAIMETPGKYDGALLDWAKTFLARFKISRPAEPCAEQGEGEKP